jgi:hypothetical protein
LRHARATKRCGICQAIVEEDEATVRVRLLVCMDLDRDADREYMNCPVHVYLDQPLGEGRVIDVETELEAPLFVSTWDRAASQ